jgi:hypothetical protein
MVAMGQQRQQQQQQQQHGLPGRQGTILQFQGVPTPTPASGEGHGREGGGGGGGEEGGLFGSLHDQPRMQHIAGLKVHSMLQHPTSQLTHTDAAMHHTLVQRQGLRHMVMFF